MWPSICKMGGRRADVVKQVTPWWEGGVGRVRENWLPARTGALVLPVEPKAS